MIAGCDEEKKVGQVYYVQRWRPKDGLVAGQCHGRVVRQATERQYNEQAQDIGIDCVTGLFRFYYEVAVD